MIARYRDKLKSLDTQVKSILKQEVEEKEMRLSEMELSKAHNLMEHKDEIMSRPARTWIKAGQKRKVSETGAAAAAPLGKKAKKELIKKKLYKKPETVSDVW